ncbi:MAG: hypothetical protein ACR2QM_09210 [Longimicrobiales bacterium]
MIATRVSRRWTALVVSLFAMSACDDSPTTAPEAGLAPELAPTMQHRPERLGDRQGQQQVRKWIRGIRKATRPFKTFENAAPGGYVAKLSECVESPAGGMGYHYGNPALIDTQLDPLRPEILLYEPRKNGSLRFVGVEYIVPIDAWTENDPPEVNGFSLHRNDLLGLWLLHVWTERHNPSGTFEDFNPRVSCAYAPPAT